MGDLIVLEETRKWKDKREREKLLDKRVRIKSPDESPKASEEVDVCIGREGTVVSISVVKNGIWVGKVVYSVRCETARGYIKQSYFREEFDPV